MTDKIPSNPMQPEMILQNRRVLLIEDDEIDQRAFLRKIREMGVPYECKIAGSCEESRSVLRESVFDVIISDYNLTDGTVFDIIGDITKTGTPLIVTTGFSDPETAVKALQSGATDYLVKDPSLSYLQMIPLSVERSINRVAKERLLTTLEAAVQQTRTAFAITSPDMVITYCNQEMCHIKNRDRLSIIGSSLSSLFTDQMTCLTAIETAGNKGRWKGEVSELIQPDELRWYLISITGITDVHGEQIGFLTGFEDISLQKESELAIGREKERLSITLRSIGDGVLACDNQGRILFINPAAQSMLGARELTPDMELTSIYIPRDPVSKTGLDNDTWLTDSNSESDLTRYSLIDPITGKEHLIEHHISSLPLPDGSLGKVIIFRDVTDAVRKEEEERRLSQLESLGLLAGGIAHDLNNILTIVLSNLIVAKELSAQSQELTDRLTAAEQAVTRAKSLSKQFLTFSPGGELVREPLVLEAFLRSAPGGYIKGGNIQLVYDFSPGIPPVFADPGQLGIAVHQIIRNAVESMAETGSITIRLGMDDESPDSVRIEIRDTGVGIPADILPRVFEPYFSTKKEMQGLGLTTAHAIISRHTGSISISSTEGTGTVVSIVLPVSDAAVGQDEPEIRTLPRIPGNRVLIMDDELMIQEILSLMIQRMGYVVDIASDGEEALVLFDTASQEGKPYSLVILDLIIPGGMGGKDTIAAIRQRDTEIPVMVSSGYSNDPIIANYQEYGFSDSLPKPYTMDALKEKMKNWAPLE